MNAADDNNKTSESIIMNEIAYVEIFDGVWNALKKLDFKLV